MKRIIILFIIFSAVGIYTNAQVGSTYTRMGIGDIDYSYSADGLGIGGLGISLSDPQFISINNPASWNRLKITRIVASLSYGGLYLSNNLSNSFSGKAQFGGFTFAFPVSRANGIAVAMGIVPYTSINYNVEDKNVGFTSTSDTYNILYNGTGGLSKTFIGGSYTLPFDLSIGATFEYYFGSMNYNATTEPNNTSSDASTSFDKTYNPSGVGTTFGLISPDISKLFNSKSISDFRIGLSFNYISSLSTDTLMTSASNVRIDTIGIGTVDMKIPMRISGGLSFAIEKKYYFTLDASAQSWSDYSFNNIKDSELRNSLKLSSGFEYVPAFDLGMTDWQRIIWRAGISYEQTPYQVGGIGINQFSIAGGFSYPLSPTNTIDIAIQYAIRGSTETNLIRERTITLNAGLSLGSLWFIRSQSE